MGFGIGQLKWKALRGLGALAMVLVLCSATAPAAERMVLGELFMADWCSACGQAAPTLGTLFDSYYDGETGEGQFNVIFYHLNDGSETNFGNTRWSTMYTTGYIPTISFAGDPGLVGVFSYAYYEAQFRTKREWETDITIDVAAKHISGLTYKITMRVCREEGGSGAKTMRVFMAYVEDHYPNPALAKNRNCVRDGLELGSAGLVPGQCVTFSRQFDFSGSSTKLDDVRMVVWVQDYGTPPAEVYQSRMMTWPFPEDCNENGVPDTQDESACDGSPWCDDCNENGVLDECDIDSGYSSDDNGNGIPDECESLKGDSDCDGEITFADINWFVDAVTLHTYCDDGSNSDMDGNGSVGFEDINPFVAVVTGAGVPLP
jgi:hypothetical protein